MAAFVEVLEPGEELAEAVVFAIRQACIGAHLVEQATGQVFFQTQNGAAEAAPLSLPIGLYARER